MGRGPKMDAVIGGEVGGMRGKSGVVSQTVL